MAASSQAIDDQIVPANAAIAGGQDYGITQRLCVGLFAVSTTDIEGKHFVAIQKHGRHTPSMLWLTKVLGISAVSALPEPNVLTELQEAIKSSRGKKSKFCRKLGSDGIMQSEHITITLDGYSVTMANSLAPLQIEASIPTLTWLIKRLQRDLQKASAGNDIHVLTPQKQANESNLRRGASQEDASVALLQGEVDDLPAGVRWWQSKRSFVASYGSLRQTFPVSKKARQSSSLDAASSLLRVLRQQRDLAIEFAATGTSRLPVASDTSA